MNNTLKNRLVGTIIVVALIVIFLPNFLDGKKEEPELLFDSIPAIPDKKPIINPEPFPSARVEQSAHRPIEILNDTANDDELVLSSSTESKAQAIAKDSDKTQVQQQPTQKIANKVEAEQVQSPSGWVIQLGSFGDQKNVRLLIDKLESAGYRSFASTVKTNSGLLTKVFVGPELQKNKLDEALPHLKKLTGINGKVTRFTVQL